MNTNQELELKEDLQKIAHGFKSAFLDELFDTLPAYKSPREFFKEFHKDDCKEGKE